WLTLNLGLRYDYYAPLTEADNQIANVDLAAGVIKTAGQTGLSDSAGVKPDRGNFAPRLGAAATLNDSTVLRGGYALSFSPPFVGAYRRDEANTVAINNAPPGPGSVAARRPFRNVFPDVGGISLTMNAGTTDYRAMHLLVERRFIRGWGARVAYTLAKSDGTQP